MVTDSLAVRPFRGRFLVHRSTSPRQRHDTFSAAEAECQRLLRTDPDGTYIVTREEARISRRRGDAR